MIKIRCKNCKTFLIFVFLLFFINPINVIWGSGSGKMFENKPAITTTIEDASLEVPFFDGFRPAGARPLQLLPKNSDGSYQLNSPGYYLFEAKSYCLNAGKYAPGDEMGYLYAPLKGPKAAVIKNILNKAQNYPEISQEKIQTLIWAIDAKSAINYKSGELYQVAKKLMTAEELIEVNKGVINKKIAARLWERFLEKMPLVIQELMEAQSQIRDLIADAQSSYDDLESAAILSGDPPETKGSRKVPRNRWSFHPDGYFIRLTARGFASMLIEIYLPGNTQISFDHLGRISAITDKHGNKLETSYKKNNSPASNSNGTGLKRFEFSAIKISGWDPDERGKIKTEERLNKGSTYYGLADQKDTNSEKKLIKVFQQQTEFNKLFKEMGFTNSLDQVIWQSKKGRNLINILHYYAAVKNVMKKNGVEKGSWERESLNIIKAAAAGLISQIAGSGDTRSAGQHASTLFPFFGSGGSGSGNGSGPSFNPSGVTGAGGNTGAQSVAASGSGTDNNKDCRNQFDSGIEQADKDHLKCVAECQSLILGVNKDDVVAFNLCKEVCDATLFSDLENNSNKFSECLGDG